MSDNTYNIDPILDSQDVPTNTAAISGLGVSTIPNVPFAQTLLMDLAYECQSGLPYVGAYDFE